MKLGKLNRLVYKYKSLTNEGKVLFIGIVIYFLGIVIRYNSHLIAWPSEASYPIGQMSETSWAIQERAINEIAISFMILGAILILISVIKYIYIKDK